MVKGVGEILATDNGDPCDMTEFSSTQRKAFSGMAQGIIRSKEGKQGTVEVTVSSLGLESSTIEIKSN